jgi:hypothetical protein
MIKIIRHLYGNRKGYDNICIRTNMKMDVLNTFRSFLQLHEISVELDFETNMDMKNDIYLYINKIVSRY